MESVIQKLPDKLSDLLELALSDLIKCQEDSKYEIDMAYWVRKTHDRCVVCLAGAVLAQTCGLTSVEQPDYLCNELENKAYAIDYARRGMLDLALNRMEQHGTGVENFGYLSWGDGFVTGMKERIDYLRSKRL